MFFNSNSINYSFKYLHATVHKNAKFSLMWVSDTHHWQSCLQIPSNVGMDMTTAHSQDTGMPTLSSNAGEDTEVTSIIGFAAVLVILVGAIVAILFVCICYGLCKLHSEPAVNGRHPTNQTTPRRNMVPLPSPRVTQPPVRPLNAKRKSPSFQNSPLAVNLATRQLPLQSSTAGGHGHPTPSTSTYSMGSHHPMLQQEPQHPLSHHTPLQDIKIIQMDQLPSLHHASPQKTASACQQAPAQYVKPKLNHVPPLQLQQLQPQVDSANSPDWDKTQGRHAQEEPGGHYRRCATPKSADVRKTTASASAVTRNTVSAMDAYSTEV